MELDIFDEINLFEDVEQENEKYINAIEALELMAYKTNNSITNVARRLLLDEFNKTAYMFKLNEFEKIELYCSEKGFDGGYVITTEFLKLAISTLGTFDYVETDIYGNEYEYSQADWFDYYWLKSDYFQCVARFGVAETDIKKLKAFEAMRSFQFIQERQIEAEQSEQDQRLKADFKVISEIFMDEVKEFDEKELQQTDPNIESLNAEIARLRNLLADQTTEIQDLKSKIQELETHPTIQDDNPDILALILDETQTDRYAPDLVYSIKLWLDVYVNNPKADSHNNKANTWIKNNTPYNGEQDDTPTRRIREIATPFRDLHQSRKRLLENK